MQKSDNNQIAKVNRRKVKSSTTLSRKYTKRPAPSNNVMVKVKRSPQVTRFASAPVESAVLMASAEKDAPAVLAEPPAQAESLVQTEPVVRVEPLDQVKSSAQAESPVQARVSGEVESPMQAAMPHPIQATANSRMQKRMAVTQEASSPRVSARQLKDQAIQKALASASRIDSGKEQMKSEKTKQKKSSSGQLHFGFGRVLLALGCAAAAVFAIVYFVNLNMPDISLRVAAMQTGINPTYPNYIPRDYNVSSITSEEGKITMEFANSTSGGSFTLVEEKSSWDTNALASNYVKEEYGENYSVIREQGLTIYISGSDAAWVNGGVVYKIDTTSGSLTNKQIRSIATSL